MEEKKQEIIKGKMEEVSKVEEQRTEVKMDSIRT